MCGRYAVFDEEEIIEMRKIIQEIDEKFAGTPQREEMRTGEIFPTNTAPVLLPGKDGGIHPAPLKWGYPRWDGRGVVINARGETAGEKKMFQTSLAARRCVIPASGFYEWKTDSPGSRKKVKYLLRHPDTPIMYMAGLYQSFTDLKTGKNYTAFVILTTAANISVAPLHDRMPVILGPKELNLWMYHEVEAAFLLTRKGPLLSVNRDG